MKYEVIIVQSGWGCFTKPEHFLGNKTIYNKIFDDLSDALLALRYEIKVLSNKFDICREWNYSPINPYTELSINTKCGKDENWNYQFKAEITKWTEEEFEELKKLGLI